MHASDYPVSSMQTFHICKFVLWISSLAIATRLGFAALRRTKAPCRLAMAVSLRVRHQNDPCLLPYRLALVCEFLLLLCGAFAAKARAGCAGEIGGEWGQVRGPAAFRARYNIYSDAWLPCPARHVSGWQQIAQKCKYACSALGLS